MIGYFYKAYDSKGAVVSGEIAATTRNEALAKIRARGLTPFEAAASGRKSLPEIAGRAQAPRLSRKAAANFYRQMAVMLGADLRVDQALGIVERLFADRRQASVIGRLRENVRQGRSLSSAMTDSPASFHPYEIALFRNGELRGDIAGAAAMAADLLERSLAVRARFVSAMIYPAILAVSATAAILVVALVLAPTILPMYERGAQSPPPAFAALIALSNLLRNWWWALAIGLAGIAAWLIREARRDPMRRIIDLFVLKLPIFGGATALSETARMTRTLAALLKAGAPLPDALGEAVDVLRNSVFQNHFRGARERVRRGEPLSMAISGLKSFPPAVLDFIVIGENTGRMSDMLAHAAEYAETQATRAIDQAMTALSPMLTLLMGLLVGSLIAVVLSAILGANEILVG